MPGKMILSLKAFVLLLATASCACTSFPNAKPYHPEQQSGLYRQALQQAALIDEPEKAAQEQLAYRIHPTDVIEINVFDYEKMNVAGRVGVDGKVNFPPLGEIQVAGLTQREVETAIADKLRGAYLQNPKIIVFVKEATSQNIIVLGEVRNPGQQAVWGETRLLDVLAKAGGVTSAASNIAYLVRASASGNSKGKGPSALMPSGSALPMILASASSTTSSAQALTAVASNSSDVPKSVMRGSMASSPDRKQGLGVSSSTLASAVSPLFAPGSPGYPQAVMVSLTGLLQRGEKDWNIPLYPGDVLTIPPAGSVYVTGSGIAKPGTYPLTFAPKTIREVIDEAGGLKWGAKRDIILVRNNGEGKTECYEVDYSKTLHQEGYDGNVQAGDRLVVLSSGWRQAFDTIRRGLLTATATFSPGSNASVGLGTNALFVK